MLKAQLTEINARRQIQEAELATIDNMALRQRLESGIERLMNDEMEKERQVSYKLMRKIVVTGISKKILFPDT